jgi:hypothetical protein
MMKPQTRRTQRTVRTLTRPQVNSLTVLALFAVHDRHMRRTRLLPAACRIQELENHPDFQEDQK